MKKWKSLKNSRYKVEYNDDSKMLSFYLAGPTHDDTINNASRQNQYALVEDMLKDSITLYLSLRVINERYHAVLETNFGESDLGILTKENGLDEQIYEFYNSIVENKKNRLLKIISVDTPWNNDIKLIKVEFSTQYIPITKPKHIELPTVTNIDNVIIDNNKNNKTKSKELVVDSALVNLNTNNDIVLDMSVELYPGVIINSWNDIKKYLISQCLGISTIQNIINMDDKYYDQVSASQS